MLRASNQTQVEVCIYCYGTLNRSTVLGKKTQAQKQQLGADEKY